MGCCGIKGDKEGEEEGKRARKQNKEIEKQIQKDKQVIYPHLVKSCLSWLHTKILKGFVVNIRTGKRAVAVAVA